MKFQEMKIAGAWLSIPDIHEDSRGSFNEIFRQSSFTSLIGRSFEVKQVNQSSSAKGAIRGIHSSTLSPGQAKLVTCSSGLIWDVIVDLRPESETYGLWDAAFLSEANRQSVFISEGLGHAFLSLEEKSVVTYLTTSEYQKENEVCIFPFDETLGIDFNSVAREFGVIEFLISEKDSDGEKFNQNMHW